MANVFTTAILSEQGAFRDISGLGLDWLSKQKSAYKDGIARFTSANCLINNQSEVFLLMEWTRGRRKGPAR